MWNKKRLREKIYFCVKNIIITISNHVLEGERQFFFLNVVLRRRYCIDNAGEWSPVLYRWWLSKSLQLPLNCVCVTSGCEVLALNSLFTSTPIQFMEYLGQLVTLFPVSNSGYEFSLLCESVLLSFMEKIFKWSCNVHLRHPVSLLFLLYSI